MGTTCSTHWKDEKLVRNICRKTSKRKDSLGDLDIGRRIILKWALKGCGLDSKWLRIQCSGGCCEHGIVSRGSIKGGELLNQLSDFGVSERSTDKCSVVSECNAG